MNFQMNRIPVMHMVDTLSTGGRERVVVNLVNALPRDRYSLHLCTTRYDGPLSKLVARDVGRLRLARKWRFDIPAVRRLVSFTKAHRIQILHAHDAAIFLARIAAFFPPYPIVVWHDHFGTYATEERPVWLYRPAVARVGGVITVNEALAEWSRRKLCVSTDRVRYIPNFVCSNGLEAQTPELPGRPGERIACVANLRAQKDHITLLRAMAIVIRQSPTAHLLLVGASVEEEYGNSIQKEITRLGLDQNVSSLGQRDDVSAILKTCDIGVLSSASEGLPLALLEYGMASLPVVATEVGQCAEVLDHGRAGIVVPAGSPDKIAEGLISLLKFPERRRCLGKQLYRRVQDHYSQVPVIEQICRVYETALTSS